MLLREPALDAAQICKWMADASERSGVSVAAARAALESPRMQQMSAPPNPHFDFSKARAPLLRARAKSIVRVVKPLRRLATNQEAVNEGLIDAVAALIATNKLMARQIEALTAELAALRAHTASRA